MEIIENNNILPNVPRSALLGRWQISDAAGPSTWKLVAVGDIGICGKLALHAEHIGNCVNLFGDITGSIQNADVAFGNLETPLIDDWSVRTKGFAGSSKWTSGLAEVGFDILHLATNHMLDFGVAGFCQTIRSVKKAGLIVIGAGQDQQEAQKLLIQQIGDIRLGWLAAGHTNCKLPETPRLWELNVEQLVEHVRNARQQVDVLVVSLHWGPMLVDYPYIEQYQAAHLLVDNGASGHRHASCTHFATGRNL